MQDDQLRQLESDWSATGSLEAEAALVAARLRCGATSTERLLLAAHLGSPAAQSVVGTQAPPPHFPRAESYEERLETWQARQVCRKWLKEICQGDKELALRLAVAALQPLLERKRVAARHKPMPAGPERRALRECAQAADCWLLDPSPEFERRGRAAARDLQWRGLGRAGRAIWSPPLSAVSKVASLATELVCSAQPPEEHLALIAAEVVPWTLGHSDPVAERVELWASHDA